MIDTRPQAAPDRQSRRRRVFPHQALRFPLLHPSVVSVIPGGQSVEQVRQNKAIMSAEIPDALWSDLKSQGLMREDAPTP